MYGTKAGSCQHMPTLFAMCACKATLLCLMLQANAGRTWPSWFLHSHQGCTRLLHLLQTHSSTCKKLRSLKFWNIFHNKVRITNLGTRRATPFPFSSLFLPFFSPSPSSFFLSFSSGPQTAIFCPERQSSLAWGPQDWIKLDKTG